MTWHMDDEQAETDSGRRISLPEPDIENITVLTKSLPNEPILPWHHFDSPWLERDEADANEPAVEAEADAAAENLEAVSEESPLAPAGSQAESTDSEQLSLALEEVENGVTGSNEQAPDSPPFPEETDSLPTAPTASADSLVTLDPPDDSPAPAANSPL
ncbi:MAG: hypothetical protein ICV62_09575 [Cyanobacteria bacterium Co-bin13]|nr:hypothetical protein [Cyanobacteria bacterium Co-bin13]